MDDELRSLLEGFIYNNPLALTVINDPEYIDYINKKLPFSTGFEIECTTQNDTNKSHFADIPYIMDTYIGHEQKFRISNGIAGLTCLYNISEMCKDRLLLNDESGIHYHVDATTFFNHVTDQDIEENSQWILEELDSWGYTGTYNRRMCGRTKGIWVRFHPTYKTLEFRIGEMTFDYSLMVRRILHLNAIVLKLGKIIKQKYKLGFTKIEFPEYSSDEVIKYISSLGRDLTTEIRELNFAQERLKDLLKRQKAIDQSIQSRIIKL